jgi:hypothetical protein
MGKGKDAILARTHSPHSPPQQNQVFLVFWVRATEVTWAAVSAGSMYKGNSCLCAYSSRHEDLVMSEVHMPHIPSASQSDREMVTRPISSQLRPPRNSIG